MIDITSFVEAVISVCVVFVSMVAIPWLRNKIGAQNLDELLSWVRIAVMAAEQLYNAADGEQKKLYVLNYLYEKGYNVDEQDVENAIEAAVLELHSALYGVSDEGSEEQNKRCGFTNC